MSSIPGCPAVLLAGLLLIQAAPVGAPAHPTAGPSAAGPQTAESAMPGVARVERNVIYGMYSGLALLLDVYHPEKPNGFGVIYVYGSGWSAPIGYDARPLKNSPQGLAALAFPLVSAGYTVFSVDHRAAPRFHWPAQIDDVERAVRFVRYYAKQSGINPARLGAIGYSSGAHLVSLLGLLPSAARPAEPSEQAAVSGRADPVERQSAHVECVIGVATPSNLAEVGNNPEAQTLLTAFLGRPVSANPPLNSALFKQLQEASPSHYVKTGAPPFLLIHGDADELVPIAESEQFARELEAAHVPVKLLTIKGGTHNSIIQLESDEYRQAIVQWMDEYLRRGPR